MRRVTSWVVCFVFCFTASLGSAQSLWRDRGSLIADPTARAVGDVLTIVIQERETINQDDRTRTERDSETVASVNSFNIKPDALPNPLPDLKRQQSP